MSVSTQAAATIADLERTTSKAELIDGRIVHFMPTGCLPGLVASEIFIGLRLHSRAGAPGRAFNDNVGFTVPRLSSGRESFSPDAAYYTGPMPANWMKFAPGPPTLAVEVRSDGDHGPAAEREMAEKRADYFEAGTLVVWDVDPVARWVRSYRHDDPDQPSTFTRGQEADAEPAVPGWRIAVDDFMVTPE